MTKSTLNQFEVTLLAVYLLGGGSRSIDTEDIAAKCHELMPEMFSWQKYPDQINLEIVRVNLSNAKKIKSGVLLAGTGREGWRLTSKGIDWIAKVSEGLSDGANLPYDVARRNAGSIDTVRKNRERKRLLETAAWARWVKSKSVEIRDVQDLFRIDGYTTEKMLQIKITRLRTLLSDDPAIDQFLDAAGKVAIQGMENEKRDDS